MIVRRLEAAFFPYLLNQTLDFASNHLPTAGSVCVLGVFGQQPFDLSSTLFLVLQFIQDQIDFQPGESIKFQFQNRVGLLGIQSTFADRKLLHDLVGSIGLAFTAANDANDLIQRVKDQGKTVQDMNPPLQRCEFVLQSPRDHVQTKVQEVPQYFLEPQPIGRADFRILRRHQARHVDVKVLLKVGVFVQIGQHFVLVGVFLQQQIDTNLVGRKIADFLYQRQLAGKNDFADPFAK